MMLIYPNQHNLDRSDNATTMGLPAMVKANSIYETASYDKKADYIEEMVGQETVKNPNVVEALTRTLRVWNYADFDFHQIGEGFFGNVYRVTHKTSGDILVLKELKSATDEEHKSMFVEEIKTMHRLCHPNVLKCEGMALHDDNLCLLTEYIKGGSLDELLVKRSLLLSTWEARLSVALEIARGMHYLHSEGVIHRDLASKNILIRMRENDRMQAIVADLGLCHTVQGVALSEEEYDLETVGSPFHMAPEVLNHKPYNMKADVFSYGIILCEIITMSPGADPDDVPRNEDFGLAVEDFSEMASDCPSSLLDLTVRCCQFNPRERPTFDQIVKALDIMLDKFVASDDELLTGEEPNTDHVLFLDHSIICTCTSDSKSSFYEEKNRDIDLGVEVFKDRFGSVRKRASRRVLKNKLQRCPQCGGRIWKSRDKITENEFQGDKNLDQSGISDLYVTPKKEPQLTPIYRGEFSAGVLLNESQDAAEFCKLVDNTPGKLPKFFRNLLRHKRGRKSGSKEFKRRWRKSFHEMFSPQSSHADTSQKLVGTNGEYVERMASPTLLAGERIVSSVKDENVDANESKETWEKQVEKPKKISKFRKKSEHRFHMSSSKSAEMSSSYRSYDEHSMTTTITTDLHNSNGLNSEACEPANGKHSPILQKQTKKKFTKKLAVSVDSLDKLSLAESVPSQKSRHARTQSVETPCPPLRKKSSSSSKLLNFLRRKSLTSPRDKADKASL